MKGLVIIFSFAVVSICSCNKSDCTPKSGANCICTLEYDPVCGCDDKTYSNSCSADCAGVEYTSGECP